MTRRSVLPKTSERQIVLAAEITNNPTDFPNLDPMITTTLAELYRRRIQMIEPVFAHTNATAGSTGSTEEAGSPCGPIGGY